MGTQENLRKLFLGGLDRDTTEDDIRQKVEGFGQIVDLVVLRDRQTQKSKGFGFVTFELESSVDDLLADRRLNGFELGGRSVEIKRAIPRDDQSETSACKVKQIFIGGIPRSVNEETAKRCIMEWSAPDVPLKIDLVKKREEPSQLRGFGFLDYENEDIVDKLIIKQNLKMNDRDVEVKKAAPKDQMGQVQAGGRGGRGGRGGMRGGRGGGRGGGFGGQQEFRGQGGGWDNYGNGYDSYSNGSGSYGGGSSWGGAGGGGGNSWGNYGGGDYSGGDYGWGGSGGGGWGGSGWGGSGGWDQGRRGGRGGGRYQPY